MANKLCITNLNHSDKALIGGGVSGDGEASSRVSGCDAIHRIPGWCAWLVFVCYCQIRHNHIHTVLRHLSVELR